MFLPFLFQAVVDSFQKLSTLPDRFAFIRVHLRLPPQSTAVSLYAFLAAQRASTIERRNSVPVTTSIVFVAAGAVADCKLALL